jgi:hypothetical protein
MRKHLQAYLMENGYAEKDAEEIAVAYIGGGVNSVIKVMGRILPNNIKFIERIKTDVLKFEELLKEKSP